MARPRAYLIRPITETRQTIAMLHDDFLCHGVRKKTCAFVPLVGQPRADLPNIPADLDPRTGRPFRNLGDPPIGAAF
jgi:hypothetical protein